MICRKCKEHISILDNFAHTSAHHNYHWNCLFDGKTEAEKYTILLNLPQVQVERIPWRVAKQHGILAQVKTLAQGSWPNRGLAD